jgi:hypothetical protein
VSDAITSEVETDTAYHEAGHAVCGCLIGRFPLSVTIVRAGHAAGRTEFEPGIPNYARGHFNESPERKAYARQRVLETLAGTIAHDLFMPGRTHDSGDEHDFHFARELMIDLVNWKDHDAYLAEAKIECRALLGANWKWVAAVAEALLQRKTLSPEDVLALKPGSD